jgi:8-oxo-dGTP diphosphatase
VQREYPERPLVGVGAIVLKDGEVLLVRRGHPPAEGTWAFPGGLVELGESAAEAVRREVEEECQIQIKPIAIAGLFEPVVREGGRIKYHYVVIDFVAEYVSGELKAASDAWEARWVPIEEAGSYPVSDDVRRLLERAKRVGVGRLESCCPEFKESLSELSR